jgi:gliding motility-associated-like protein
MKQLLTAVLFLTTISFAAAQGCTTAGQTPSTAFPVCGTSVFQQTTVPICGTHNLTVPGCSGTSGALYQDKNPYWYQFTCYQPGSLGFLISPLNSGDDYDWQLYDITGHNPDDVFVDKSLTVTGNWAGTFGNTGASNSGVSFIQCASDPAQKLNSFAKMPSLVKGHTYLLLVSHYTDSQSGYDLSFGGGTAVITDTTKPNLKYSEANCGGDVIRVKLNKKMKCSSIASNGSDFYITPGSVTVARAISINCSSGFDTDSVELQLSSPLGPGTYNVNAKKGSDGNTLLDNCDNSVPEDDKVAFTVLPLTPTPMDSLSPLECNPQYLRLVFRKPMLCSSVAADGSDFTVRGPYPVTVTGAKGNCTGASRTSKEIIVSLSQPLYRGGIFTLTLQRGTDGNTLLDECNTETVAGSTLTFTIKDTVNADFTYQINYGCATDAVNFSQAGDNGIISWQWNLDENIKSNQQNPQALYKFFNTKKVTLIVSNGFCADTSSSSFVLDNFLKADFDAYQDVCPNEPTKFTNLAQGHIVGYSWQFGDGLTSPESSPSHIYAGPNATTALKVSLTVTDSLGCESTAEKTIKVYVSCYLAVPNAFTPNGDGKNDLLYPLNAIKADNLSFKVFDRWGQLIFETNNWKHGWDGTFKGTPQPPGVYVWFLSFTDRGTKEHRQMKGTAALIR